MLLAVLLQVAGTPQVVEVPEPGSNKVVVQAFVRAPEKMSDREQAAWNVLADALYDGTTEFSRDRLAEYGSQAGVPLAIEALPDHIKIQVVEPKDGLKVAGQILEAIVENATLADTAILESLKKVRANKLSTWEAALFDYNLPYEKVTADIVRNLYKVTFRPENMTLVFGGEFETSDVAKEVGYRFPALDARQPRRSRFDFAPRQRTKHLDIVSTFELRCPPITLGKSDSAARFLAVFALGVGKEGALHRVLREQEGLTYRQEAVLWATQSGWTPRLLFAKVKGDHNLVPVVLEKLKTDAQSWDSGVLSRAKAMVTTSLEGRNPLSPFWIGRRTLGTELEDRCAWAGLNTMMYGEGADLSTLSSADISLEELKTAALTLLEEAGAGVIPGG